MKSLNVTVTIAHVPNYKTYEIHKNNAYENKFDCNAAELYCYVSRRKWGGYYWSRYRLSVYQ